MVERYGILLIDEYEVILRVYEVTSKEWKLTYYFSKNFVDIPTPLLKKTVSQAFSILLKDPHTRNIHDWRLCARSASTLVIDEILSLVGLQVEKLNQQREQELLCKGLFTELW